MLLLLAVVVVARLVNGTEPPVGAAPRSTEAFVDSIGVNVHFGYFDTSYGRQDEVLGRLRELGIRHVRDGVPLRNPQWAAGLRRAADQGIRPTLITSLPESPQVSVEEGLRDLDRPVDAFEGPNEVDRNGGPDWPARLRTFLPPLRATAQKLARGVPVVGPSFIDPLNYRYVDSSTFDLANFHPYPGGAPPEKPLAEELGRARIAAPNRRLVFTETGYHNALQAGEGQPPVPEWASAVYLPRLLLSAFRAGAERTFIYELLDEKPDPGLLDPEQHFGLLRQDLTPKPAFDAVRNLIAAARTSPGPAGEPPAFPTLDTDAKVEQVSLGRPDGSRLVAMWQPVSVWDQDNRRPVEPSPAQVGVTWSKPVRDLSVTRPSAGGEVVRHVEAATNLSLQLGADVLLLSYR